MFNFLASTPIGRIGEGEGLGKWNVFSDPIALFETILSNVVGFLTIVGGLWFMIQFIIGTYTWINAGGDKTNLKQAQDKITHAVVGLVILVAAYALVSIIGSLVGLDILNPANTLNLFKQ